MFEICVKVTVMLGTSVRVEPTAGPPHPPPPTQTTDFVTRVDTVSQGPACNRSVPRERSETPQVSFPFPNHITHFTAFCQVFVKNRYEESNFKLKIKKHCSFNLEFVSKLVFFSFISKNWCTKFKASTIYVVNFKQVNKKYI